MLACPPLLGQLCGSWASRPGRSWWPWSSATAEHCREGQPRPGRSQVRGAVNLGGGLWGPSGGDPAGPTQPRLGVHLAHLPRAGVAGGSVTRCAAPSPSVSVLVCTCGWPLLAALCAPQGADCQRPRWPLLLCGCTHWPPAKDSQVGSSSPAARGPVSVDGPGWAGGLPLACTLLPPGGSSASKAQRPCGLRGTHCHPVPHRGSLLTVGLPGRALALGWTLVLVPGAGREGGRQACACVPVTWGLGSGRVCWACGKSSVCLQGLSRHSTLLAGTPSPLCRWTRA